MAQLVVVDQVLIAQRQGEHTLAGQGRHAVLDLVRRATIDEAGREPPHQPDRPVGGAQQQRAGIRGDGATVEPRHHRPAFNGCKLEAIRATLCRHWGVPPKRLKMLLHNNFRRFGTPMHLLPVRNPG